MFKVNRKNILSALKDLKALKPKNVRPETEGAIFEIKNGGLHITATDYDVFLTKIVRIEQHNEVVSFAVSDRNAVLEALEKIKDEKVSFTLLNADQVRLDHGKGFLKFSTFDGSDLMPPNVEDIVFEDDLEFYHVDTIAKAAKFTSKDTTYKANMCHVCLEYSKDKKVKIQATNSNYAYLKTNASGSDMDFTVLIPNDVLKFIEEGALTVYQKGAKVKIENESTILCFKNPLGLNYPKISSIIRHKSDVLISVKKKELQEAIGVASLASDKETNAVILDLARETLSSRNGVSESSFDMSFKCVKNGSGLIDIAFNHKFLSLMLKEIDDEVLTLQMQEKNKPLQIYSSLGEMFILMPVLIDYGVKK